MARRHHLPSPSAGGCGFRRIGSLLFALCLAAVISTEAATFARAAVSETFAYTGGEQTFIVPTGVLAVHAILIGGSGGASGEPGGAPVIANGDVPVSPGETLYIEVGGSGQDGGAGGGGGFNGGGAGGSGGGPAAGGGGGASDIRTVTRSAGSSLESRLIVAGGGGGAGGSGELSVGGEGGAAGFEGEDALGGGLKGWPGFEGSGGAGGAGTGATGVDGQFGTGGTGGSSCDLLGGGGGGGGGGYYGGGGGGGGCETSGGGGGGGGMSFSVGTLGTGVDFARPPTTIEITYGVTPSISIVSPGEGATYAEGEAVAASYSCAAREEHAVLTACAGPVADGAAIDTATPGEHSFEVSAEDDEGDTAIQSVHYTVLAQSPPSLGPGTPSLSPGPALVPPNTLLRRHPKRNIRTKRKKVKVKFAFHSDVSGARFECKLDKRKLMPCSSPKRYKVKRGRHRFTVEAVSAAGADPTPATFRFSVKREPRSRRR